jgi:hypothetical protein
MAIIRSLLGESLSFTWLSIGVRPHPTSVASKISFDTMVLSQAYLCKNKHEVRSVYSALLFCDVSLHQ